MLWSITETDDSKALQSAQCVCVCEEKKSIAYTIKPPRGMQRFPIAASLSTSNSRHQQNLLTRACTGRAEGR